MTDSYRHRCHRPSFWNFITLFIGIIADLPLIHCQVQQILGSYHYIGCYSFRTDLLTDSIFARSAQTCIDHCENLNIRYAILLGEKCYCDNIAIEEDRRDIKLCNKRCEGNKSLYCGGIGVQSYYLTLNNGPPVGVNILNSTENSILITWNHSAGDTKVTEYIIKAEVLHSYTNYPFFQQPEFIVQSTQDRFEMTDLYPATTYNVSISAQCGKYVCGSHYLIGTTKIGVPDPLPKEPTVINRTSTTIVIEILPYVNNNGPVSKYRIIVEKIDDAITQLFDEALLYSYQKAQEDGTPYYIAGEINYANSTQIFTVGDNETYGGYWNAPLNKDDHIHVSLGVISTLNGTTKTRYRPSSHNQDEPTEFQYADFEPGNESLMALTIVCIVFAIILLLSVIIYLYLKRETARLQRLPSDSHELTMQGAMMEAENDGFIERDDEKGSFKEQLNCIIERLEVNRKLPRNAIRMNIDDVIAFGRFGEVVTGKLYANSEAHDCQVHLISEDMNLDVRKQFLQDFENIARLMPHDKFLYFYGITASADWFYLVFENCKMTLKKRLIESRLPANAQTTTICTVSEECVLQWIYEVATAMEYLIKNKVLHKHLCCYSVYLSNRDKVKVSLFGPIADTEGNQRVDLSRWLAPEVLRFENYSQKSDVWAFAVLAWECCTLGATPYSNIANQDLLPRIKNGLRPEHPRFVFSDLYQLFLNCWQLEPSERPDFDDVAFNIRQILTSPQHALSFNRDRTTVLPPYFPLLEVHN